MYNSLVLIPNSNSTQHTTGNGILITTSPQNIIVATGGIQDCKNSSHSQISKWSKIVSSKQEARTTIENLCFAEQNSIIAAHKQDKEEVDGYNSEAIR